MKPLLPLLVAVLLVSCVQRKPAALTEKHMVPLPGTFGYDLNFLKSYKNILVLGSKASRAKVLVVGDYQARVMTSTANGDFGNSYGWINYKLIRSGATRPHINPFGGEDRFWLGPEGGQFGLFFRKGDPFDFDHWQTPAAIDTEPFEQVSADSLQATFRKSTTLINHRGAAFELDISRQIRLMGQDEVAAEFGVSTGNISLVAYETINEIRNTGADWKKESGLISIWILGMFNPSDNACIVLPYKKSNDEGSVTDDYFGPIPKDRIAKTDSVLFLKGDGKFRGKVGVAPMAARNVAGSYDADKHILTIIKFDLDKEGAYVNSKWEMQRSPYQGDAVNSYNDGPHADGSQLGPFYELESSSPAMELKKGGSIRHRHLTFHAEGSEDDLNVLAEKILGIGLKRINRIFQQ
jgi:hypothetical protein